MAWQQLLEIMAEAKQDAEYFASAPPVACPNDGWPLVSGPEGELFCVFDGWIWAG